MWSAAVLRLSPGNRIDGVPVVVRNQRDDAERRRPNSRNRLQALGESTIEVEEPLVLVARLGRLHREDEKPFLVEPELDVLEVEEGLDEEARSGEQQDGQRDLKSDQDVLEAGAAGRHAVALPEDGRQIHPGRPPGRRQAEENACDQRNHEGEREHPQVETGIEVERKAAVGYGEADQSRLAPDGEQRAGGCAQHGEKHRFGHELSDETSPTRAEGQPRGDLGSAEGRPGEKQVRQVGARDQQHERHDQEQSKDRAREVPPVLPQAAATRLGDEARVVLRFESGQDPCRARAAASRRGRPPGTFPGGFAPPVPASRPARGGPSR